jgi:hypothetical protein
MRNHLPDNTFMLMWMIYLAIAGTLYLGAWQTKNPEYVTLANIAAFLFATSFAADLYVTLRSKK